MLPGDHAKKLGEEIAELIVKRAEEVDKDNLLLFCSVTVRNIVEELDERRLGHPDDFTVSQMFVMSAELKSCLADAS